MMTTKAQDRAILAKIENLLKDQDPDGYLMTAFAGCIEDARENIENDFSNSWKDRAEHAREQADKLAAKLTEAQNRIAALEAALEKEKARTLSRDDLNLCTFLTISRIEETKNRIETNAAKIIELADEPDSSDFRIAVANHRRSKKNLETYSGLRARLEAIKAGA